MDTVGAMRLYHSYYIAMGVKKDLHPFFHLKNNQCFFFCISSIFSLLLFLSKIYVQWL